MALNAFLDDVEDVDTAKICFAFSSLATVCSMHGTQFLQFNSICFIQINDFVFALFKYIDILFSIQDGVGSRAADA